MSPLSPGNHHWAVNYGATIGIQQLTGMGSPLSLAPIAYRGFWSLAGSGTVGIGDTRLRLSGAPVRWRIFDAPKIAWAVELHSQKP
jgi:hypothetical protein